MRLLLDECVPRRLKKEFGGHEVKTAREAGLGGLKNGDLLRAAEGVFDALITVDQGISLSTEPEVVSTCGRCPNSQEKQVRIAEAADSQSA